MAALSYYATFLCICSCTFKLESFLSLYLIISMKQYSISKRLSVLKSYLLSGLNILNQISVWLMLDFFSCSSVWMVIFLSGGLGSLKKLHHLTVDHNQLISTRGLSETFTLLHVDCSYNHISHVEGLENCALLNTLDLRGNNLTEVNNHSQSLSLWAQIIHIKIIQRKWTWTWIQAHYYVETMR